MADKRDMKGKSLSSSSKLVELYNNRKLCTKVDNMLDEGMVSYDYIIEFCKENGLEISKATLTNYKKKREESIETGKPLLQLLDKRAKDNITYIKDKEITVIQGTKDEPKDNVVVRVTDWNKVDTIYSDLEFLDEIINKGMKGLRQFDVVDTPLALKAVELRAKITNNQLSGLTIAGLRELKLRQQARESALMEIIMKYVPEDQHDQLFIDMDEAEQLFYENLDLTDEDRRINDALKKSGMEF